VTRTAYVEVATLDDLREAYVTLFEVAGRPVILTRVGDAVHAFDGTCTHAEFQFATSRLVNGCEIECPMHGACFDAETGEVTHGPAEQPLQSIDVQVEGGVVRLCVDWADATDPV
jgi:3-phenylpropionate/trans-cinnamate dioxygenase ferredoxin component